MTRRVIPLSVGLSCLLVLVLAACSGASDGGGVVPGSDAVGFDVPGGPDTGGGVDVGVKLDSGGPGGDDVRRDSGGFEEQFGEPCVSNEDCETGYCVQGPQGGVCTRTCLTDCPEGWACQGVLNLVPDVVFICVPLGLSVCQPCQSDVQCGEGRCATLADGKACLPVCDDPGDCGGGFICGADLAGLQVCRPQTGSCACRLPEHAGIARTCSIQNAFGTCYGIAQCDPLTGWQACEAAVPSTEICNGRDDDCDGVPDDDLPETQVCEVQTAAGVCVGTAFCAGAQGWLCQAAHPEPEICDLADNDCDGQTDEGFRGGDGRYTLFEHCGRCNQSCANRFPNATARCDVVREPPTCIIDECAPGFVQANDFLCLPEASDLCQPCQNDSNCPIQGAKCLQFDDGRYCTRPCETTADCLAGYSCAPYAGGPAGDRQCQPTTGSCSCHDGNIGFARPCGVTWTDPQDPDHPSYTCTGQEFCQAGGWSDCTLPAEVCDGFDNDCDGRLDEGFRNAVTGKYDTRDHCGACGISCVVLDDPARHARGVCDPSGALPSCRIQCDGGWFDVNENPGDGCECRFVAGADHPDAAGTDSDCDGVDGEIGNAVFVSKEGHDVLGDGSIDDPVRSVGQAIALARALSLRDVYVATGLYEESIELRPGVHVYGGYSADFRVHDPRVYETTLFGQPPTTQRPATVTVVGLEGAATLDGFTIYGRSRSVAGGTSIAVYVRDAGSGLTLTNNRIVAGDGGYGARGSDGTSGADGLGGVDGYPIHDTGSLSVCAGRSGGAGGQRTCSGTAVHGGAGGNSQCPVYDASVANPGWDYHAPGENGSPGLYHGGAGGEAGYDAQWNTSTSPACGICRQPKDSSGNFLSDSGSAGGDGLAGADGTLGAGCSQAGGQIAGGVWTGVAGQGGGAGDHGGGGGGGGAGGGVQVVGCSTLGGHDIGGSGGGGGSGGCGGSAATGGGAGGGSFGILVVFTVPPTGLPRIQGNDITTGLGGVGGDGGTGGKGGAGGGGAAGGIGNPSSPDYQSYWCASEGGNGGHGGRGGHGGGGGGGCGGVSYGVYVSGAGGLSLTPLRSNSVQATGAGGTGGRGGASLGRPGTPGATGATSPFNF
jgi:hypothetical protein